MTQRLIEMPSQPVYLQVYNSVLLSHYVLGTPLATLASFVAVDMLFSKNIGCSFYHCSFLSMPKESQTKQKTNNLQWSFNVADKNRRSGMRTVVF